MLRRLSPWLGVASFLLLLGIAVLLAFGLPRGQPLASTLSPAGEAGASPEATVGPGEGWTPPVPGVTNTPPTPTPGISYREGEIPEGMIVTTSEYTETEFPEPVAMTPVWETPSPTPPPPTPTPLPTVSADNRSPYAAHNLVLAPASTPVSARLRDQGSSTVGSFMDWSLDGALLALSQEVGETKFYPDQEGGGTFWAPWVVYLFDAAGQELGPLVEGEEPLWSPTGAYLAVTEWNLERMEGSVKVVELSTRQVSIAASLTAQHSRVIKAWISDTELAFYLGSQGQGELLVFDVTSGQQSPLLNDALKAEMAQDAPGENLRVISSLPARGLISIRTREVVFILQRDEMGLRIVRKLKIRADAHAIFAPDGNAVALLAEGDGVQIFALDHPEQPPVYVPFSYRAFPLVWSPDGSSLMFPSLEGSATVIAGVSERHKRWYIVNRDCSGLRLLSELPANAYHVMWTVQGVWTVQGDGAEFAHFSVVSEQ